MKKQIYQRRLKELACSQSTGAPAQTYGETDKNLSSVSLWKDARKHLFHCSQYVASAICMDDDICRKDAFSCPPSHFTENEHGSSPNSKKEIPKLIYTTLLNIRSTSILDPLARLLNFTVADDVPIQKWDAISIA